MNPAAIKISLAWVVVVTKITDPWVFVFGLAMLSMPVLVWNLAAWLRGYKPNAFGMYYRAENVRWIWQTKRGAP